ncbi:uncharacterized protein [Palaemon carinicauda]|uniref:uncharacterized protein n=1 Tax=Palaemon carinicauda TaxID=392227 RepID=UPI0035B65FEA
MDKLYRLLNGVKGNLNGKSFRNPDLDDSIFDCLLTIMAKMQEDNRKASFMLLGDFNAHHRGWLNSVCPTDHHDLRALVFVSESGCEQIISEAIHRLFVSTLATFFFVASLTLGLEVDPQKNFQLRECRQRSWRGDIGPLPLTTNLMEHPNKIKVHSRSRRFISWPSGSTLTVYTGLSVPLHTYVNGDTMNLYLGFPFTLKLPTGRLTFKSQTTTAAPSYGSYNSSGGGSYSKQDFPHDFYYNHYFKSDSIDDYPHGYSSYSFYDPEGPYSKRSIDSQRHTGFSIIQNGLENLGLPGKSCLMRAVCEVADEPVSDLGLVGDFLNLFLAMNFSMGRNSLLSLACVTVLWSCCLALDAFKGDPGELGDSGFDLSKYSPSEEAKARSKRFISFPSSSTLTFNHKIKIPVFSKLGGDISGVFKGFIRAIYTLPSDTVSIGRGEIDKDRYSAYNSIESLFSNFGMNGHECLLKAICETAEEPTEEYGLLGELLELVLSPNHEMTTAKEELRHYVAAETYGRDVGNCDLAYSSCPYSLNELVKTGVSLLQGSMSGF